MTRVQRMLSVALLVLPASAIAQSPNTNNEAQIDFFYSTDADNTAVMKAGVNLDLRHAGPEHYLGFRLETARFNPSGQGWQSARRFYVRAADGMGDWKWEARAGTDGHTLLGSATIHNNARVRQEYFLEREIVETPQGLARGIYSTFVGGAVDLPVDDRNSFTFVAALQEFTGQNVRTHLRANFIHVVSEKQGLTAHLRARYFTSSAPGEYDYYSPRWYAEVLPVLQLRGFKSGWRYAVGAGVGVHRDAVTDWKPLRYANVKITSPSLRNGWAVDGGFTYTNAALTSGFAYSYLQFNLGAKRAF